MLIAQARTGGQLDPGEAGMLAGVFHLHEQEARQVMTPIPAVVTVDVSEDVETALRRCVSSGHTRLVVTEDENPDRVRGTVHANSLARQLMAEGPHASIEPLVKPALIVPETKPLDDLLADLQRERSRWPSSSTSTAASAGIVTVEDIVEEVVGEIDDETDPAGGAVRRLANGDWFVRGHVAVSRPASTTASSCRSTPTPTTRSAASSSPSSGACPSAATPSRADGYSIRVESVRENRIEAVRIRPRDGPSAPGPEGDRPARGGPDGATGRRCTCESRSQAQYRRGRALNRRGPSRVLLGRRCELAEVLAFARGAVILPLLSIAARSAGPQRSPQRPVTAAGLRPAAARRRASTQAPQARVGRRSGSAGARRARRGTGRVVGRRRRRRRSAGTGTRRTSSAPQRVAEQERAAPSSSSASKRSRPPAQAASASSGRADPGSPSIAFGGDLPDRVEPLDGDVGLARGRPASAGHSGGSGGSASSRRGSRASRRATSPSCELEDRDESWPLSAPDRRAVGRVDVDPLDGEALVRQRRARRARRSSSGGCAGRATAARAVRYRRPARACVVVVEAAAGSCPARPRRPAS